MISGQRPVSVVGSSVERLASFTVAAAICVQIYLNLGMTSSRGVWLPLAVVGVRAVAIALGGRLIAHWRIAQRVRIPIGLCAAFIGLIGLFRFGDPNWLTDWLGVIPVGQSAVSRLEVYGQAWGLIRDYVFTGAGSGVFPMVVSSYALLMNVPILTHAHNLILEIWIEEGILVVIAFLWLVVAFYVWAAQLTGARVRGQGSARNVWS